MAYSEVGFQRTPTVDISEKVGQVTEGVYLGSRGVPFGQHDDGSADVRTIVDMTGKDGKEFSFWAPTSVKMLLPQIETGTPIRLTYRGEEKNKRTGRKFKAFTVEADEGQPATGADRIPV